MTNRLYKKELSTIAKRIKHLREQWGMSQTQFAKLIGVTQPAFASLENERSFPSAVFLIKLKNATHISLDTLLGD